LSVSAGWRMEDFFADAIVKDPVAFLGPDHVEAFGVDTGLLVKLLDPGERLIVHSHPDRTFANRHLGCAHGKDGGLIVALRVSGRGLPRLRPPGSRGGARRMGGVPEHRRDARKSQHALGEPWGRCSGAGRHPSRHWRGVFAVELQEPTDFSFALEHRNFTDPDLRLGWDLALSSVDRSLGRLIVWPGSRVLG